MYHQCGSLVRRVKPEFTEAVALVGVKLAQG